MSTDRSAALLALALASSLLHAQNSVDLLSRNGADFADNTSGQGAISADGQVMAFRSLASNLVPGIGNSRHQIYVRVGEALTVASVDALGAPGNHDSGSPVLSADGRVLVFGSFASNLWPNDTNNASDIFWLDRQNNERRLLTRGLAGQPANGSSDVGGISADGRHVVFASAASNLVENDSNARADIFLADTQSGTITLLSRGIGGSANGNSTQPSISADGAFVVFNSEGSNLVDGDTNGVNDVFLWSRAGNDLRRINLRPDGTQAQQAAAVSLRSAISQDGRYSVFSSADSGLVPPDGNGRPDVFVYDRLDQSLRLVSRAPSGSPGLGLAVSPSISGDGSAVVFEGRFQNFVPNISNNWELYRRQLDSGVTNRVSQRVAGEPNNQDAGEISLSNDGRLIVFSSSASNLVPGTQGNQVFLSRREPPLAVDIGLIGAGFVACPNDLRGAAIRVQWSSVGTSTARPCRFGTAVGTTASAGALPPQSASFDVILTNNEGNGLATLPVAMVCRDEDSNDRESRIEVPVTRRTDCPPPPVLGTPQFPWVSAGAGSARLRIPIQSNPPPAMSTGADPWFVAVGSTLAQGFMEVRMVGTELELLYRLRNPDEEPDAQVTVLVSNGASTASISVPIVVPPAVQLFTDGFEP